MGCWIGMQAYQKPSIYPYWWVAPTLKQASIGMEIMRQIWGPVIRSGPLKTPPYPLTLASGGRVEFRTWDDPANLMGTTIAGAVVDEAGLLIPAAQAAISTRRSATLGPIRYIGNPGVATGPFRKLCGMAEAAMADPTHQDHGVYSMHKWTWEDKRDALPPDQAQEYERFIEQEKRSLPGFEFRRLYEAEWTSDEAAVFTNVHEVTHGEATEVPEDGHRYVIGLDVGQSVDYLVAVVLDVDAYRACHMLRFRGVGYPDAAQRLKGLQERFNAPVTIEINGPGIAVAQEFERIGVSYQPFQTTNQSKQEIVLNLAADFQNKRLELAELPPLQYELEVYRYNRMPSGVYRYEAPAGEHDDCVMALAFAAWARQRAGTGSLIEWVA